MSNDRPNLLFPFLAGLAAGAALGILFAPRSGRETREAIKDRAQGARDSIDDLVDEGRKQWSAARGKAADAASMSTSDVSDLVRFLFTEGRDLVGRIRKDTEHEAR
ncbi:MAG TPA: YtxH domain-containing protein [Flavobacteriales bacterium]|jgi:gas vesicle protein|nr:YtxH domain-containing protein [Flavobacteriales bacterium]